MRFRIYNAFFLKTGGVLRSEKETQKVNTFKAKIKNVFQLIAPVDSVKSICSKLDLFKITSRN